MDIPMLAMVPPCRMLRRFCSCQFVCAFSTATKTYRMLLLDIQLEIDDARSGSRHAELVG